MKPLPIGISTLSIIRDSDMVYIDKTMFAYSLIKYPSRIFLTRPRRFGKSLFVDTLKQIFEGNEALFRGLYIHDKWDWSRKFPVIKLDFAGGGITNTELLDIYVKDILERNAKRLGLPFTHPEYPAGVLLKKLIEEGVEKYGEKAAVLVDEYDKPLLDNIENPMEAIEIREGLKNLYSVLKEQDEKLHFAFLTGVSKFSKVNIFSGINNLEDITLDERYATICGYTQEDLEQSFQEHLEGVDWQELKQWYNGYNFLGEPVYNPFDILLFLSKNKEYRNYWFETGTPSFLIKLLQKNRSFLPDLENLEVGEELLDSFDIERMEPSTLLFQSGYLTIGEMVKNRYELRFTLRYPNYEVRRALNKSLIYGYTAITTERIRHSDATYDALRHAFATHFLESGGGIFQLQKLLGHKALKTTLVYAHVQEEKIIARSPLDVYGKGKCFDCK